MNDMLEPSSLTADEAMDMARFVIFTVDSGVAQSADGSSIWLLSSRQHSLEEDLQDEAAEFFDRASDDDGHDDDDDVAAYRFDQDLEDEAAEFFDRASDDDDGQDDDADVAAYRFDPEFGYPTEETLQAVILWAQEQEVDFETVVVALVHYFDFGEGPYGDDGAVVPASDAAVAGLEKQAFHATAEECRVTGCAICLEDFEDGEEVAVMPCSRGHEFHSECITEWLGKSNTCPLCRHALPTDVDDGP